MALRVKNRDPGVVRRYKDFKPHLRLDFSFECVYCGLHENEVGGIRGFAVDHFRPKSKFPQLTLEYSNVLYACCVCNTFKGDDWPHDDPLTHGKGYLDPCVVDYDDHFERTVHHELQGISEPAKYMVDRLHLNRRQVTKHFEQRVNRQKDYERRMSLHDTLIGQLRSLIDASRPDLLPELELYVREKEEVVAEWEQRWHPFLEDDDYRA